jgi:hypothetical protein
MKNRNLFPVWLLGLCSSKSSYTNRKVADRGRRPAAPRITSRDNWSMAGRYQPAPSAIERRTIGRSDLNEFPKEICRTYSLSLILEVVRNEPGPDARSG